MNKITAVRTDIIYGIGTRTPLSRYAYVDWDGAARLYRRPYAHAGW